MSHKVLVVDDDPQIVELICMGLASGGYASDCASNGKDAIAKLESNDYDLVIMDIVMPEQDGIELSMHFHQTWPELKFVVMSGAGNTSYLDVASRLGAKSVLQKPFKIETLLETVREVFAEQP